MALEDKPRYLRAALIHGANLTALGGAGLASVALQSPLPALLAAGVELVYLGIVPSLPFFRRGVEQKHAVRRAHAATALADQMLAELSPSQRDNFLQLRELKEKILESHTRLGSSDALLRSSEGRIDQLLASFLRLLSTLNAYRRYLNPQGRAQVERELHELVSDLSAQTPEKIREVAEKRAEILRKRLARYDKAAEHRELMSHQLASIEDLLRLLHEQSIGMRDPEVVSQQLETVAAEVESTESTVRELEAFLSFDEPAALPSAGAGRERVR